MASQSIKCAPAGMSTQRAANPPESRGGALWSVFRGEAFDPQGGAPTDKSDAVRHFVVGSLCRNQRGSVAALPTASKEVLYEQNQSNPAQRSCRKERRVHDQAQRPQF